MRTFKLNVATIAAVYVGLAIDTALQLVNSAHLCADKFFYDKQGEHEYPCSRVTVGLLVTDVIMICLLPLFSILIESLNRHVTDAAI